MVLYYGAIGALGVFGYDLIKANGDTGQAVSLFKSHFGDLLGGVGRAAGGAAGAAVGTIPQLPQGYVPGSDAAGVYDLGKSGVPGFAWGQGNHNGWWVVTIKENQRIGQALNLDAALQIARTWFGG